MKTFDEKKHYLEHHKNKFGYRGVVYDPRPCRRKKYRAACYLPSGKRKYSKYFETIEEAAAAYDSIIYDIYGDKQNYFNFPLNGEKKIKLGGKKNECPNGHDRNIYSYVHDSGQINCRKCNNEAVKRYNKRIIHQ